MPLSQNTVLVTIPTRYHNTWNFALGADYYPTEQAILRAGIGYDNSPVPKHFRNVQVPDINRYVVALGGHYQVMRCFGVDLGWTHLFTHNATIRPPAQVVGAQVTQTNGSSHSSADLFGIQFTWDMV